jgi:hypothetical protein
LEQEFASQMKILYYIAIVVCMAYPGGRRSQPKEDDHESRSKDIVIEGFLDKITSLGSVPTSVAMNA